MQRKSKHHNTLTMENEPIQEETKEVKLKETKVKVEPITVLEVPNTLRPGYVTVKLKGSDTTQIVKESQIKTIYKDLELEIVDSKKK